MADTTPNLQLIVPELNNPNESFDWVNFIRNNFYKIDGMKVLGGMRIYNAAEYTEDGVFDSAALKADALAAGDLAVGLVIYFPPGVYDVVDAGGLVIGEAESVTGGLYLLGAKGAIITTNSGTGASIADIINVTEIDDVTIVGLTIQGHGADTGACVTNGIRLRDVRRAHIQDVYVEEVGYGIVVDTPSEGFLSDKIRIVDNMILNYNKNGIDVREAGDTIISRNFVERETDYIAPGTVAEGHGIKAMPGQGARMLTYTITDNTVLYPRRNGIELANNTDPAAAPSNIKTHNNTVEHPGQHVEPTTELVKATRGSGINSNVVGRLSITANTIRQPISHGILVTVATMVNISGGNEIEIGSNDRVGLEGLSWHGIAVDASSGVNINGNKVEVGNPTIEQFQGEDRCGIKVTASNHCAVSGNMVEGSQNGIYVYDSDYPMVTGNNVNNSTTDSGIAIHIDGALDHTSNYPIVTGNQARGRSHGIYFASVSYVLSPVAVGNHAGGDQGIHYTPTVDDTGTTSVLGNSGMNSPDSPFKSVIDTPYFAVDSHGRIANGRYIRHQFINAAAMVPNAAASLVSGGPGTDDPAILFNATADAAYAWLDLWDREVTGNDASDIIIRLVFSSDTSQQSNIELTWWAFSLQGDGNNTKGSPTAMGNTGVNIAAANRYQIVTVTIPLASISITKQYLALKIADTRSSGSHNLWLHSIEVEYQAKHTATGS